MIEQMGQVRKKNTIELKGAASVVSIYDDDKSIDFTRFSVAENSENIINNSEIDHFFYAI